MERGHGFGGRVCENAPLRRQRRHIHRRRRPDESGDRIVPDEDQVPDHHRLRHDRIDAKAELEEGKLKAQEELDDAKAQIDDGEAKLTEAKTQYSSGLKKWQEGT